MLHCNVVPSRGRPPFLTQIEWDLIRSLTSQIKVREVSRLGHYMYSEYIRVVQIEEEIVWVFSAEIYTINVHPGRLSVLFVDLPLWSWFVLSSWCVFFQSFSYFVIIVTPVHLFSAVAFSFAHWTLSLITTLKFDLP